MRIIGGACWSCLSCAGQADVEFMELLAEFLGLNMLLVLANHVLGEDVE